MHRLKSSFRLELGLRTIFCTIFLHCLFYAVVDSTAATSRGNRLSPGSGAGLITFKGHTRSTALAMALSPSRPGCHFTVPS